MAAGGYIALSGRKTLSYNSMLKFIQSEYKLSYKVYIVNKSRQYTIYVDIYIKEEKRLLLMLTGNLYDMENRIYQTLHSISIYPVQINYR